MVGMVSGDYRVTLRSIKSPEDVGKLEEAEVERFLYVESFEGLLDTMTDDDEHCSLPGRYLEGWNAFKGPFIELVTRRADIRRLTPLIQRIIPLLRYLDDEDRRILAEDFFVTADDMYEYGQKICVTIAENACEFGLPILRNILDRMAQTAKTRRGKFLELFMGISCDLVKKFETKFRFNPMVASLFVDLQVKYFSEDLLVSTVLRVCNMALRAKGLGALGKLELELNNFNGIDIASNTKNAYVYLALELLFRAICKLVMWLREDLLSMDSGLPNIHNALQSFQSLFISKSESWKEAHVEQELHIMVTVVLYTLKVINKEDVEDNFPREILVADSCGLKDFKFAVIYLFRLGKAIARRLDEAIMLLHLSCELAWKGILVFCESPDPTSDEIYSLITDTCAASGSLMCLLHDETEIVKTLKYNLMIWFDAQLLCEEIPLPLAIIEAWVYIQYNSNQDPQAWDNIVTTHGLMSSLDKITIDALQNLTEQELEAYTDMKNLNPDLFDVMERKLTTEYRLVKAINHIQNALELLKVKNIFECKKSTSEAISILLKLLEERECDLNPIHSRLSEACCLHALCMQEEDPKSENVMHYISRALMFWSRMDTLSKKDVNLLVYMFDLLTVKGNHKHHAQIYGIMLKYFDMKNADGLKNLCSMLWKSRRLSHAICGSPVCGVFLDKLSKCCKWWDDVNTWKKGMEEIEAHGFEHKLTLSAHVQYHRDAPMSFNINQVEEYSTDLIQREPVSSYAQFLAGNLYYDIAESMIANGSMIKALHYAEEAFKLRTEILNKMFHIETQQEKTVDDDGKVSSRYNYQTFTLFPEVATTAWSHDEGSNDSQNYVLTPWNTLQGFLDSSLQYGTLEEDVDNAEKILVGGMNISSLQGLRLFSSRFSLALGKFYMKQHKWDLAVQKIQEAEQIWIDIKRHKSCSECNTIFEISIKQAYGDVWLESKSKPPRE